MAVERLPKEEDEFIRSRRIAVRRQSAISD